MKEILLKLDEINQVIEEMSKKEIQEIFPEVEQIYTKTESVYPVA